MNNDLTDIQRAAAEAAFQKMVKRGYFDICVIDRIRELAGLGRGASEAYQTLHLLHCVDFDTMKPELRAALPGLVAETLNGYRLDFTASIPAPRKAMTLVHPTTTTTTTVAPEAPKRNIIQRFLKKP